jgi:aminoglycoside phosphotransferase (APT) family kinase protein
MTDGTGSNGPGETQGKLPGVEVERLLRFFAAEIDGGASAYHVELLSGGSSNLTYRVLSPARSWVVRRQPLGHVLPTAHDMSREYRILSALRDTGVPVANTVAYCDDLDVMGCPFYVMDYCAGVILTSTLPDGFATSEADRARLSRTFVETLALLHSVDYEAVGLADFGRPDGYLERQVRRWVQQWERSKTRELSEVDQLVRRMEAAIPRETSSTIVHGDYRLANMVFDSQDPGRIVALLDWEMATLGDPLADLGYTFIYWGQQGDEAEKVGLPRRTGLTSASGFMPRAELAALYEELTGRSTRALDFYQVLAAFKLGVITEGIYTRFLQGKAVGDYESLAESSRNLFTSALEIADESADARLRGERL